MENLLLSLNIVMPLFIMMALGYLLRRLKCIDPEIISKMNRLAFQVFIPLLLFQSVYESDITSALDGKLIGYVLGAVLVNFVLVCLLYWKIEPNPARRGTLIHGTFRGNTALFGIPVALALFGEGNVAAVALVLGCTIPLFNILAVLTLNFFSGHKVVWKTVAKDILTNPLIIGVLLGMVFALLHLSLPQMLYQPIKSLAAVATPLSFILLGASFSFTAASHNRNMLLTSTVVKLVVMPVAWIGLGALLGFRDQALAAIMTVFAPPAAVTSFSMAQMMGGDVELAGEIVVFTSLFSILTLFIWLFAMKNLGWL